MTAVSPLQSEQGKKLLDAIDKLRLLPSISHEIALPQIVVVGQQSSGKSSVLKAISNINFPTNDGLCTHFATEIICRREARARTRVSIIPSEPADERQTARLDAFSKQWENISLDQSISEIIESARQAMGLNDHRRISKDKLRLEFSGPQQDHISLIDLPGLFEMEKKGQRLEDKEYVDQMVKEYVSGQQTIVLAVVSGASDYQAQRIFNYLEPCRERTVGVITAPDLVVAGSGRAADFQELAANASFKAGHEWYVLRNLSYREQQEGKVRDEVEEGFFANRSIDPNDVWRFVPESRLGIKNFKCKLAQLLQKSIVEGLPQIQRQLHNAIDRCNEDLRCLGDERLTTEQQRDFLAERSEQLRAAITRELNGGTGAQSLRSSIRNANDVFADNMTNLGAYWSFIGAWQSSSGEPFPVAPAGVGEPIVPVEQPPIPITNLEWYNLMFREISGSRGCELDGLVEPVWVGRMFLRQSRKWSHIAFHHAEEAFNIVSEHFDEVVERVVGSELAPRFLLHAIYPELEKRKQALETKVMELLSPYTTEHIRTLNRNFRQRTTDLSSEMSAGHDKDTQIKNTVTRYTADMLQYYNVALAVFVDNIESLAIENVLLGGLDGIMTGAKAHRIDTEQVAALVAESEDVTLKRLSLQTRMHEYKEGSRIISSFAMRTGKTSYAKMKWVAPKATSLPSIAVSEVGSHTGRKSKAKDKKSGSASSSDTVRAEESPERSSVNLSSASSSRASSKSRVFSDGSIDEEEPLSNVSSVDPSPAKPESKSLFGNTQSPFSSSDGTQPIFSQPKPGVGSTESGFGTTPSLFSAGQSPFSTMRPLFGNTQSPSGTTTSLFRNTQPRSPSRPSKSAMSRDHKGSMFGPPASSI